MKKAFPLSSVLCSAVSICLVLAMCVPSVTGKIALAAAGLVMPEGMYSLIMREKGDSSEKKENAQTGQVNNNRGLSQSVEAFSIPEDVLEIEKKYTVLLAKSKVAGKITEKFYTDYQATHSFGNVFVRNTTATQQSLDIENKLAEKAELKIENIADPTVLIFHSHTSEGYQMTENESFFKGYKDRTNDESRNVVRVGTEIVRVLKEHGIGVIHDKVIHDDSYSGAYGHSRSTVSQYLEKYPSIRVVIDVHRDAIHPSDKEKIAPTAVINGKKSAQVMIITGVEEGKVEDFPDWEKNLRFALALQQQAQNQYEGLMRPVLFSPRKYNMDVSHCGILLEMGSDANTLGEAVYAGALVADSLANLLKQYT